MPFLAIRLGACLSLGALFALGCGAATGLLADDAGTGIDVAMVDAGAETSIGFDAGFDGDDGDDASDAGFDGDDGADGDDAGDGGAGTCIFRAPGSAGISEATCPAGNGCVPVRGCVEELPPEGQQCGAIECACVCASSSICNCSGG